MIEWRIPSRHLLLFQSYGPKIWISPALGKLICFPCVEKGRLFGAFMLNFHGVMNDNGDICMHMYIYMDTWIYGYMIYICIYIHVYVYIHVYMDINMQT